MPDNQSLQHILITGGAGFLGSHLCAKLLDMGYQVTCVDNLITGDTENIDLLKEYEGFSFIDHDVVKPIEVEGPIDAVLHFASPASPRDYLQYPMETLNVGSVGTHASLNLAMAMGARFLLASTSEVYGDPLVNPQPESYWGNVNPVSPRGVYDEAKRFAEAMTMAYHRYKGVDTRIVRIFNTFGPRMRPDDGRVISNFIVQVLRKEPITVYGDGSQTRSFCYVEDTTDAIICVLLKESDKTVEARTDRNTFLYESSQDRDHLSIHHPINVGNPQELSILAVAKLVLKMSDGESAIVLKPLPVDDPRVRKPDISKARSLLGWEPQVRFEDGLARTMEYFAAKLASPVTSTHVG